MAEAIQNGSTSNHFSTQTLRALGGWDAFNVTKLRSWPTPLLVSPGYCRSQFNYLLRSYFKPQKLDSPTLSLD